MDGWNEQIIGNFGKLLDLGKGQTRSKFRIPKDYSNNSASTPTFYILHIGNIIAASDLNSGVL